MKNNRLIPTDKIIERLQYENPWWVTNEIPTTYKEMSKRLYFDLFYPFVKETDIRRAVVLMGPRRVGKTVMMFHTIDQLINERSEEHTSELQSRENLVCRLLLEKKKDN